jgi:DNA-binding NarL/FixJ family response regulator
VAAQVAAGKTNREAGAALFLSEKTIESHLGRIYNKLDVHSRAALAALIGREAGARNSPYSGPAQSPHSPAS